MGVVGVDGRSLCGWVWSVWMGVVCVDGCGQCGWVWSVWMGVVCVDLVSLLGGCGIVCVDGCGPVNRQGCVLKVMDAKSGLLVTEP